MKASTKSLLLLAVNLIAAFNVIQADDNQDLVTLLSDANSSFNEKHLRQASVSVSGNELVVSD